MHELINLSCLTIPLSLSVVRPFLCDGIKYLRLLNNIDESLQLKYKKIVLKCINGAFKLNRLFNCEMNCDEIKCMENFLKIRNIVASTIIDELSVRDDDILINYIADSKVKLLINHTALELIMIEADIIIDIADALMQINLIKNAVLNYHTACIYYHIIQPLLPTSMISYHKIKLKYTIEQMTSVAMSVASTTTALSNNSMLNNNSIILQLYKHFNDNDNNNSNFERVYLIHLDKILGKGTYGSVYLATHRKSGLQRAVKILNIDRINSYNIRKIHNEIAILKSIDHNKISQLHDVFFAKKIVYIVTDLCTGGQLYDSINSGLVFEEQRTAKLVYDMLSAVSYLHQNGIVHRDIKLENFLLADSSHDSRLILIDFGLSKLIDDGEQLNQVVGSCYYTAPEVLNRCYDTKCDVWSVGALCYMLLSGSCPFSGNTVEEVYKSIQMTELDYSGRPFSNLSAGCIDFMKRLLVKDPTSRLSASEALQHPFITGYTSFKQLPLSLLMSAHQQNNEEVVIITHKSTLLSLYFLNIFERLFKFTHLELISTEFLQLLKDTTEYAELIKS